MKKNLLLLIGTVLSLGTTAQNIFPTSGNVGIKTSRPTTHFEVWGDALFKDTLQVKGKLRVGNANKMVTIKYVPGNDTFPDLLKFSAPAGSKPIRGHLDGGIGHEDSSPNFNCFAAAPIPPFVNSLSHAVSISYNPVNPNAAGGQILMGHNGVNAFFESQSSAINYPTNLNHPGDLFINKYCKRNVLFFTHSTPFGIGQSNVVSVDGSFNVRAKMQLGVPGATFASPNDKFYILNQVGSGMNAIKIKHGAAASFGIQIATYDQAPALLVNHGTTSAADGPESFRVNADGQTTIATDNSNAFIIKNANSGTVNFKVKNTGYAYAREINVMPVSITFPDYVFSDNYRLRPIQELSDYLTQNKHLPNIPTAREVETEGIFLAQMQVKQLEKIEEAFLYIIQLKKENDQLKERLNVLESER